MDEKFSDDELLLRAVYPADRRPDFWENNRLSSAAFKDKRGLSVDRTHDRSLEEALNWTKTHLSGIIVSLSVQMCHTVQAYVKYCPSATNPYHSEIHGSHSEIILNDAQALYLARHARIEYAPNFAFII